ncbi:hypothetical protein [Collimonas silvisoli]|uniref:hypothetical protein n=1 Tax=Collimonas silvisoli TaxID=2825884 RepID=UPI001B8AD6FF|nr:hypothetical protein [Collimonas silvisoli]
MRRLFGVAASLLIHMSVLILWRHQVEITGLAPVLAAGGQEQRIDVQLFAAAPLVAAGAPSPIAGSSARSVSKETLPASLPQDRDKIGKTAYLPPAPIFYGPQEVDKGALPYSAPDPDALTDVVASGLPIRVRLYIDASGAVVGVEKLQALADDQPALERIEKMLRGTAFMPARLAGADVNSYQDLEFHIGPELNKSGAMK